MQNGADHVALNSTFRAVDYANDQISPTCTTS